MRKATNEDVKKILEYLKPEVQNCLYMYIDIGKYGLDSEFMDVWIEEKGEDLNCVVMKYHTGIGLYSASDDWDVDGVVEIIKEQQPMSITGKHVIIEKILPAIGDLYETEYGYIFEYEKFRDFDLDVEVEMGTEEDAFEMAKLVTTDHGIGAYYEVNDLANQFIERMRTDMGRHFIIRDNGKIIAHIASYAEFDGLATTRGLIVDEAYRKNSLLGLYLEKYSVDALKADGFRVFSFVIKKLRYKFLESMGNPCVGDYAKLIKLED